MEYRFCSDANKPPRSTYFAPSSSTNDTYFIEQALRAGYFGNDLRRVDPVREAIQREIEKERIREEIIATDILRKRILEAEVRRELAMERDFSMRRADGFSLVTTSSSPSMRSESRVSMLSNKTEDLVEEKLSRPEVGTMDNLFQRHPEAVKVAEIGKKSVVFLPKSLNVDYAGIKRKLSSVGEGALAIGSLKKKPHKEWSCDLCNVSATCKQGLNDHLQGKRHKSKEKELLKANGGLTSRKQTSISAAPSEKIDKLEITRNTNIPNPEQAKEPVHLNHTQRQEQAGNKNEEILAQEKPRVLESKEKYKYWCANCNVGCHSSKVMDNHQAGKKHTAQLLKQMGGGFPNTSTTNNTTTLVSVGKAKALEEVPKENNVDVEVDGGEQETTQKEMANAVEKMESAGIDHDTTARGEEAKQQEQENAVVDKMELAVVDHDNIAKGVKVEVAEAKLIDIKVAATTDIQGVKVDAELIDIKAAATTDIQGVKVDAELIDIKATATTYIQGVKVDAELIDIKAAATTDIQGVKVDAELIDIKAAATTDIQGVKVEVADAKLIDRQAQGWS